MDEEGHLGHQNTSNISLPADIYIGISSTGVHSILHTPLQGTGE